MSLPFSDTQNFKGIVQLYAKEIGIDRGVIEADQSLLQELAAEVNITLDVFFSIGIQASGEWQLDDSNQSDYAIIKRNIVSGTRDYPFTTDGSGNLILDVIKVAILKSATATMPQEIYPIDISREDDVLQLLDETTTGVPTGYDKLGNAIKFDIIPNYNATNGLEVYVNREASYLSWDDTTKKPGVPGILHPYFYLRPAREYARRNSLVSVSRLDQEVLNYEGDEDRGIIGKIGNYFGRREKDKRDIMTNKRVKYI